MDYRNYKLNAKPSPKDENDFHVTRLVPMLNEFEKTFQIQYSGEVKDQGEIGSCVPHSLSYAREIIEQKQSGKYVKFSPGFVYGYREAGDTQDEGMIPRQALNCLFKTGIVPYDEFPYNLTYPEVVKKLQPDKIKLAQDAYPHRISAYCLLNNTVEIKTALKQLGPVTVCFPIYSSFYDTDAQNPIVKIPDTTKEELEGYHEMTILGWREDNTFIVINSWGKDWADKGYCYIPYDYPMVEAWSITDNILPNPPSPKPIKYYRVLVGDYKTKSGAVKMQSELLKKGFKGTVVIASKKYKVQVGAFVDMNNVLSLQLKLSKVDIDSSVIYS